MNKTTLDLSADVIDVRDIIARVEELEAERESLEDSDPARDADLACEHSELAQILADLQGMGGDEQWRGHWYPITLIRDSYFRDYAEELAADIGAIPESWDSTRWPMNCIDWEHAARELRYDYSGVDIDGVTYWTR